MRTLDPSEYRVDLFKSSGAGGQHRNKVSSAVRLTHYESGIVVTATEDRSQHVNRRVAIERLTQALEVRQNEKKHSEENGERTRQFDTERLFVWTEWRDEVKTPSGSSGNYRRALKGKLAPLLK